MKKILAILLVIASVLSFAACKGKDSGVTEPADPEAFLSNVEAQNKEASKAAAESIAAESERQEEIDDYIKKIGKTKKNDQLVIQCKVPEHIGREYWKYEFDANGKFKSKIVYYFLPTLEQYNAKIDIGKNDKNYKIVDKDKEMKMVAMESKNATGKSFDKMYKNYIAEGMKDMGYIVVE